MAKGPIQLFRGGTGEQVFTGEASPAPGGGSPLYEFCGGNTAVDASQLTGIPLAHVDGATLLDYAVPTSPTLIAGGQYLLIVQGEAVPPHITAGYGQLNLISPPIVGSWFTGNQTVAGLTWGADSAVYVPAASPGDNIGVQMAIPNDGTDVPCFVQLQVVKFA